MLLVQMTLDDVQIILIDELFYYLKIWHEFSWPLDKLMIKLT